MDKEKNILVLRLHIPYYSEDEHPFTMEGYDTEDTLQRVTGFNPDNEEVVWDIDLNEGVVLNWNGEKVDMFEKLRDEGVYELLCNGEKLCCKENEYVPDCLYFGEGSGYGDYIQMSVEKDGHIDGWDSEKKNECLEFFESVNLEMVRSKEGFENWFEEKTRQGYDDEKPALTPDTVFISESGSVMKLSDMIMEFLKR